MFYIIYTNQKLAIIIIKSLTSLLGSLLRSLIPRSKTTFQINLAENKIPCKESLYESSEYKYIGIVQFLIIFILPIGTGIGGGKEIAPTSTTTKLHVCESVYSLTMLQWICAHARRNGQVCHKGVHMYKSGCGGQFPPLVFYFVYTYLHRIMALWLSMIFWKKAP